MAEIMINLDDSRTSLIADVISNKTCKKILEKLSEKELSEGDLSKELNMPLNTVEYNLKKLIDAGLIEKAKGFFWSVRGKKIITYKLSNKKIIILPKKIQKGIIPAVLITGFIGLGIKIFSDLNKKIYSGTSELLQSAPMENVMEKASDVAGSGAVNTVANNSSLFSIAPWTWFLIGAWCGLVVLVIWSYVRKE